MAFTYDVSTDRGKVRLLMADTREADYLLEDAEIDTLLTLNADVVRYAAADGLDIIASNEALVHKAIQLLDLKTNGPAVAAELRKHAAKLRELAERDEWASDGGFAIVENPLTVWQERAYEVREVL